MPVSEADNAKDSAHGGANMVGSILVWGAGIGKLERTISICQEVVCKLVHDATENMLLDTRPPTRRHHSSTTASI